MRILRLSALLAAFMTLAACGTAGRLLQAGGRTLHLTSEAKETPDHFQLETHEVRESLASGARIDVKPQDTRPELAQR